MYSAIYVKVTVLGLQLTRVDQWFSHFNGEVNTCFFLLIGQNENTESPTLCIIKAVQLLLNDLRSVSNKKNNYVIVILVMIKLNSPIFSHPS